MPTTVKEHPILFKGRLVRAILEGRKTQTRRVVKREALRWLDESKFTPEFVAAPENQLCPYGGPNDRLWVREACRLIYSNKEDLHCIEYAADNHRDLMPQHADLRWVETARWKEDESRDESFTPWRPSIHMPRWASRIMLEVTDVRVERIQEMDEFDAIAEGVYIDAIPDLQNSEHPHLDRFPELWDSINAERGFGWDSNPWVWVVEFKRVGS